MVNIGYETIYEFTDDIIYDLLKLNANSLLIIEDDQVKKLRLSV